jgi:hypothetical protein
MWKHLVNALTSKDIKRGREREGVGREGRANTEREREREGREGEREKADLTNVEKERERIGPTASVNVPPQSLVELSADFS